MMVKSQEEKRISHNKAQQKYELKLGREKEAKKERQGVVLEMQLQTTVNSLFRLLTHRTPRWVVGGGCVKPRLQSPEYRYVCRPPSQTTDREKPEPLATKSVVIRAPHVSLVICKTVLPAHPIYGTISPFI
jgi:hypothetical protein